MYIVKVLVEHAIYKLDTTYDYLSKYQVLAGCRVHIRFGYQQLVGYVVECQETLFTQKQLEEKNGFKYSFIQDVIDQKPLLNQELQELANLSFKTNAFYKNQLFTMYVTTSIKTKYQS